jgi:hypothetical protein
MSHPFLPRCSSNQPDFLGVFPLRTIFLLLLIILDPLEYLLLSDLCLIYDASHGGIEPVSLLVGATQTVFFSSQSHRGLSRASVHLRDVLQGLIQVLDVCGAYRRITLVVVGLLGDGAPGDC